MAEMEEGIQGHLLEPLRWMHMLWLRTSRGPLSDSEGVERWSLGITATGTRCIWIWLFGVYGLIWSNWCNTQG